MAVSLRIGKCCLVGNFRENNEDRVEAAESAEMGVYIVADGMGGQAAGEEASRLATEIVPRELATTINSDSTLEDAQNAVRLAIVEANKEIIAQGKSEHDKHNMGTTIVLALWLKDENLLVAGVGDSRVYLVRDGAIRQLTTDHSLAQALVEAKTISEDEAKEHRFRNVLWKYLGTPEVGDGPDVQLLPVQPGDRLLLCSDGVTGSVEDDQLNDLIRAASDPQESAEQLCQVALDQGSRDNVSSLVIYVDG